MLTPNLLKISDVSKQLSISRYYVNRLIIAGKLSVVCLGNVRFITRESVELLISEITERRDQSE